MSFVYMGVCTACEWKPYIKTEYVVYTFAEALLCWKPQLICVYKHYNGGKEGQANFLIPNTWFRCGQKVRLVVTSLCILLSDLADTEICVMKTSMDVLRQGSKRHAMYS